MRWLTGLTALAIPLLAGCGSSSQGTPTATPLPRAQLQRVYSSAANTYNNTEAPITQAENLYCGASSPQANLTNCEAALSQDRLTTIGYDNSLRGLAFPQSMKADVTKLLSDDAQLENLLQQASSAPSLSAINSLTAQIFSLLKTTSDDARRVRSDLGLPAASAPPSATPTPSAAA
ncbi:MAG: hypothetical protein JO198_01590 [Candidatus Dormibacteraeota bacterium]|nr:hypothetical protein [Candidatus Dormibacteraeota bacterium]